MNYNNNGQHNHKNYLRPKQVIGSCKLPISFKSGQSVFHHDDIPADKRERKNEVLKWVRSKVLSVDQPEWGKSTELARDRNPLCERRTMENFVNDRSHAYQYNYRAEVLPDKLIPPVDRSHKFHITAQTPDMIRKLQTLRAQDTTGIMSGKFKVTQEMPVHPKLADAVEWNSGTQFVRQRVEACGEIFTKESLSATRRRNMALFGMKEHRTASRPKTSVEEEDAAAVEADVNVDGSGRVKPKSAPVPKLHYVTPIECSTKILDEVRRQKMEGTFTTKKTVFQKSETPVDRSKLGNRLAIEPSRKYKVTEHSGKWEFNAAEGRHMWSDTGSFIYESRGDVVYVKNPDAYNYVTPNSVQPTWKSKAAASAARTLQPPTIATTSGKTTANPRIGTGTGSGMGATMTAGYSLSRHSTAAGASVVGAAAGGEPSIDMGRAVRDNSQSGGGLGLGRQSPGLGLGDNPSIDGVPLNSTI